jgi:hypothetical protein
MDTNELKQPELVIPEKNNSEAMSDAGEFVQPNVDQLADAGIHNPDHSHLKNIHDQFEQVHGSAEQVYEKSVTEHVPHTASMNQVEGNNVSEPNASTVHVEAQPAIKQESNNTFLSNITFPIKNVFQLLKGGIISYLTKPRGSANSPDFNGRSTTSDAMQLKNGTI